MIYVFPELHRNTPCQKSSYIPDHQTNAISSVCRCAGRYKCKSVLLKVARFSSFCFLFIFIGGSPKSLLSISVLQTLLRHSGNCNFSVHGIRGYCQNKDLWRTPCQRRSNIRTEWAVIIRLRHSKCKLNSATPLLSLVASGIPLWNIFRLLGRSFPGKIREVHLANLIGKTFPPEKLEMVSIFEVEHF